MVLNGFKRFKRVVLAKNMWYRGRRLKKIKNMKPNDINQFNNIKDNIRNHSARILQKWVDRVESRNLDTSEMITYLKATHDLSGGEMMKFMATVFSFLKYRSMHSFMKDFRCVASEIERVLDGRRFYLLMDCRGENTTQTREGPNEDKSNYYMFVLLMCIRPNLIDNLVDFACVSDKTMSLVHTDVDDTVDVCVFMDDVSFTGAQAIQNTWLVPQSKYEIVYGSVYASEAALHYLDETFEDSYASATLITTQGGPQPIMPSDIIERYKANNKTPLDDAIILRTFQSLGIESDKFRGIEFEKYLFYTDLKIPDSISIFTGVIHDLRLVDQNGLLQSVVQYPTDIDSRQLVRKYHIVGNSESETIYKTDTWSTFIKDMKKKPPAPSVQLYDANSLWAKHTRVPAWLS